METFGQKIQLEVEHNSQHMFSGMEVKKKLITNIINNLGMEDA